MTEENIHRLLRKLDFLKALDASCGLHLAVMSEPFLAYMLEGRKTIESRFSKHKIAPYQSIKPGDTVLLKKSSGPVVGYFEAGKVAFVELNEAELRHIQTECGAAICADDDFWQAQADKRYATLIEVRSLQKLEPFTIEKRDRRGWVKLR